MNDVLQWVIAAAAVAIAAVYLVRRFARADKGCGCSTDCCASCPFSIGSNGECSADSTDNCPSKDNEEL